MGKLRNDYIYSDEETHWMHREICKAWDHHYKKKNKEDENK
jgi:hypothetical protein